MKTKLPRVLVALLAACSLTAFAWGKEGDKNKHTATPQNTIEKISHATQEQIDRNLTAKDLIGKDVYDRGGEEIGSVVDVVLPSNTSTNLAAALSDQDIASERNQSRYAPTPNQRDPNAVPSTNPAARNDMSRNNQADASRSLAANSPMQADETCAVVSYGGFAGMGNKLLVVPVSTIRYDANNERLTLDVSESDIDNLTRNTAERTSPTSG